MIIKFNFKFQPLCICLFLFVPASIPLYVCVWAATGKTESVAHDCDIQTKVECTPGLPPSINQIIVLNHFHLLLENELDGQPILLNSPIPDLYADYFYQDLIRYSIFITVHARFLALLVRWIWILVQPRGVLLEIKPK